MNAWFYALLRFPRRHAGAGLGLALLAAFPLSAGAQADYPRLLFEPALPAALSSSPPPFEPQPAPAPEQESSAATAAPGDSVSADPPGQGPGGAELPSEEPAAEAQVASAPSTQGVEESVEERREVGDDVDPELYTDILRYEQAVSTLELERGPYAPELGEQLDTLAALYEASGDHQRAIASYEKAMHVVRVNEGLFTLSQIGLVEDLIRNYLSVEDFREADDRQEYLYYLKQKNYGPEDPELLEAKIAWADWNVQAYYREFNKDRGGVRMGFANPSNPRYIPVIGPNNTVTYLPRNSALGGSISVGGGLMHNGMAGSSSYMLDPRLRVARDLYEEIGDKLDSGEAAPSPVLQTLSEQRLANISFIVKQEMDYLGSKLDFRNAFDGGNFRSENVPEVSRGFVKGRDSLERALQEVRAQPDAPPEGLARALIDLADWHLVYERPRQASDYYEEAWQSLSDSGWETQRIEEFFHPLPAVQIPAYATHRYSRALLGIPESETLAYKGYVDLQMNLSRYGNVRGLKVLSTSPGTPREVQNALIDHLRISTLRPRLEAGEPVDWEGAVLRFNYSY